VTRPAGQTAIGLSQPKTVLDGIASTGPQDEFSENMAGQKTRVSTVKLKRLWCEMGIPDERFPGQQVIGLDELHRCVAGRWDGNL